MTRTFTYTFNTYKKKDGTDGKYESDWYTEEVTLTKRVTDRMESRNNHKVMYAAEYFNNILREQYGRKVAVANARNIKEI